MEETYKPRIVDRNLSLKLEGKGAVVIEGPKWCGKTTTAEQIAKSMIYISSPEEIRQYRDLVQMNPKLILEGEKPRLIDEWQNIPQIWDSIRYDVDHTRKLGQYILTGSTLPVDMSEVLHSGTGRFGWIRMRTMSLWESNDSNGAVSLKKLFDGEEQSGVSDNDLDKISFLTCRGGWPLALQMREAVALEQAYDYVDAIANRDISLSDGKLRESSRVRRLLRSLARLQGQAVSFSKISKDLKENEGDSMNAETVATYMRALERIFVTDDVQAWNPNIRSATAIRTVDTRYFTDPSIATASLGMGPKELINNLTTFGFIFETLCIRDLKIYADALDGNVFHYRDKNGLECDAVVHLRNGDYGLVEIKLGGDRLIDEGAESLKKLFSILDFEKMKKPSFMMILTAVGKYAYQRPDGIYVVPIDCLKD